MVLQEAGGAFSRRGERVFQSGPQGGGAGDTVVGGRVWSAGEGGLQLLRQKRSFPRNRVAGGPRALARPPGLLLLSGAGWIRGGATTWGRELPP